jgi:signal transduction histidine kinase
MTNTRRHSDATQMTVTVAEHPAIYQFLVADNGTKAPAETGHGIGLQNIRERINELDGYCRMNYQGGFRIFITIPKKEYKL